MAPGGSSGSYVEFWVTGSLGTVSVTVGAGGTPGAVGANPEGNGGDSTFGSYASLPDGLGGLAGGTGTPPSIAIPASPSALPTISGSNVDIVVMMRGGCGPLGLAMNDVYVSGGTAAQTHLVVADKDPVGVDFLVQVMARAAAVLA